MKYRCLFMICLVFAFSGMQQLSAQTPEVIVSDSISLASFERGTKAVNQCTPWHHVKCVFITGSEVYKDGKAGKSTRHWWRMSYIGRACTEKYGTTFGKIFEAVFAIPHYMGVALGNGIGYSEYLIRGSEEKIQARKQKRKDKRAQRKLAREQKKVAVVTL